MANIIQNVAILAD